MVLGAEGGIQYPVCLAVVLYTCHFRWLGEVNILCVWLWCCMHLNGGSTVV